MEMMTIAKEEYEKLKEVAQKMIQIDVLIHETMIEDDLLKLSEITAKELWDNKEDEIWNTV